MTAQQDDQDRETVDAASAGAEAGAGGEATAAKSAKADQEEQEEALRQQRLRRIMQNIDGQPDFASVKTSMLNLAQVSRSEHSHVRALTDLIHDDPAMLAKLLRLVNAAFYRSVGGGEITSMARAVQLLGFQKVGMLASSLRLFEALPKNADGLRLQQEFARGQLAGLLSQNFCHSRRHGDTIFLSGLFQRLGDLLAGLHFQEDSQVIEDKLDIAELPKESPQRTKMRDKLSKANWGITIEEIGHEVARGWGWPPHLLSGMRSYQPESPDDVLEGDEYARRLCTVMNGLAGQLMQLPRVGTMEEQAELRAKLVRSFGEQHAEQLGLNPETLAESVEQTFVAWLELLKALGVELLQPGEVPARSNAKKIDPNSREYRQNLADNLADAIETLRRLNRRAAPLPEVLEAALKLLQKSLGLQRALVCLTDPNSGALGGRLGVGDKAVVLAPFFDIPLQPPSCLFGLLCSKNADTLIRDVSDPVIAQRMPAWYGERVRAGTFLVLPLVTTGQRVVGMLYGDQRQAGDLVIHDRGLALLRDLRQQVLNAIVMPRS